MFSAHSKVQRLDRRRQGFDALHPRVEIAHRNDLGIWVLVNFGFNGRVRQQRRAARQSLVRLAFKIHQGKGIGGSMVDLAIADLNLASPAQAMTARMRQINALAQRRVEHCLSSSTSIDRAQGLYGQLMRHGSSRLVCLVGPAPDSFQCRSAETDEALVTQPVMFERFAEIRPEAPI